ncbi:MAG: SH3 domain-containing protein, partial [Gemmatimonadota bacterium]
GRPTPAQPAGTRYRAVDWVWFRAGPNNRSERLLVVKPNQIVRSTSRRFGWIRVTVGDQEGWVSGEFLEPVPQSQGAGDRGQVTGGALGKLTAVS